MSLYDEKDYIMRIIQEMVRVLISLMLGKQYTSVDLSDENKYEVSGKKLKDLLIMVDNGEINDAENTMLSGLDYSNRDDMIATVLFYKYLSEKEDEFLLRNNYTKEEILDGLNQLIQKAGYSNVIDILE